MNAKLPCDKTAIVLAVSTDPVSGFKTEYHSLEDFIKGCIDEQSFKVKPESFICYELPQYNCEECIALPYVNPQQLDEIVGYAIRGIAKKYDTNQIPHKEIDSQKVSFWIGKAGVFASNTNKKYMSYVLGTDDINLFVKLAKAGEAIVFHEDIDAAYQIINNGMPETIFRMLIGKKPPRNNTDLFIHTDQDFKKLSPNSIKAFLSEKKQQIIESIEFDSLEQHPKNEPAKQLQDPSQWGKWKEPKGIKAELSPVAPLTKEMLPYDLDEYVRDEANRADNMPPDFVAVCTLVALCSVVGARVGIKPKQFDDWTVIPNLWGGIIAPPSSKKSPAFNAGTYALDRLVVNARKDYDEALKEYEISSLVKESSIKALKDKLKDAGKKADKEKQNQIASELRELQDEATGEPILKRYKTNDASPEALAELEKLNPNGILVCRDELVGLLSSLDKNDSDSGRAFYLEGWNGNKPYEFDRIMRGNGFIENHCLSVLGGIQPDKLVAYLEPSIKGMGNDGLLQRFQLLVYPDTNNWAYRDETPNKDARKAVFELFQSLDNLTTNAIVQIGAKPADEYNPRPYFRFSEDAQELFIAWTTHLHSEVIASEEHPIIIQHLDKYGKLMPALALIFHLIDGVQMGHVGDVSKRCAEMAIEWCNYLETHARRIYGLVLQSTTMKAGTLCQKLKNLKDDDWRVKGFTPRQVQQKNWKSLTNAEAVSDALDILVDSNWLTLEEIEPTVKGGRPSKRYWINPRIFENT